MSIRGHVLMVEALDGSSTRLAERMMPFCIEPVLVPELAEAQEILEERRVAISAVLIPTDLSTQNLKKALKNLRKVGPASGLTFVSFGQPPRPDERKQLRGAGLSIALWEPYDDGTLRFQLNRGVCGDRDEHHRASPRVPTYLLARAFVGDRAKDAVLYSLSEGGAFLETPRASMDGAQLEIELRLPTGPVRVKGQVMFSNVPGNLQQPNLPLGMGVRFCSIGSADSKAIADYVHERLEQLNV